MYESCRIFGMQHPFLLTGHSHNPYIRSMEGKTIINPGSVGIPQDGTKWPKYAVLEIAAGELSCRLRAVPYDLGQVIRAQFASGIMDYAKYWAVGILYDVLRCEECVLELLKRVEDVHREEAWHTAALEMGMKFTEEEIKELILCV